MFRALDAVSVRNYNHTHTIMSDNNNTDTETLKRVLARELSEMQANGELDDLERAEEREQLAESAFTSRDLQKLEESDAESPSEYILDEYGVSVEDYSDSEELRAALSAKRSDLREQQVGRRPGVR